MHADRLGSVVALSDRKGEAVARYAYEAFGQPWAGVYEPYNRYGFTGKPYDEKTGLSYYVARWYDPKVGRWLSQDPIRDGVNWYAYCNNNPVNWVDPWGLKPDSANVTSLQPTVPLPKDRISRQIPAPGAYNCDIYAWNEALEAGYDPRTPTGESWDANVRTVPQISGLYPDQRVSPTPGTAGFSFYDDPFDADTDTEHMEFYSFTEYSNVVTIHRTNGIDDPQPENRTVTDPRNAYRTWVPLNPLTEGDQE